MPEAIRAALAYRCEEVFIGREWVQNKNFSESTARLVDSEVKRIVDEAHERCTVLLRDNEEALHRIAQALLDRETITGEELDLLLEDKELPPLDTNGKPMKYSEAPSRPGKGNGKGKSAEASADAAAGSGAAPSTGASASKPAEFTLEPDPVDGSVAPHEAPTSAGGGESRPQEAAGQGEKDDNKRQQ